MKQKVIADFSNSITQTINYHEVMNAYLCKRIRTQQAKNKVIEKEKGSDLSREYEELKLQYEDENAGYEEYYNKFYSLNPSYKVACELVMVYFSARTDAGNLRGCLDSLINTEWLTANCSELNKIEEYKRIRKEVEVYYINLLTEMINEASINEKKKWWRSLW